MNDPRVDDFMNNVRRWLAMPIEEARADIIQLMQEGFYESDDEECGKRIRYDDIDYKFAACCETTEEIIGAVFGI